MKKNIISALLYMLILTIYAHVNSDEFLFMWLCWFAGYSKNFWDHIN